MGAPEQLRRRKGDGESDKHHRAFLLYAMQDPEKRSLRAVSRAVPCSDNTARKWRERFGWESRLGDPEHCRHAADLYAELYHAKLGGREIGVIQDRLGAEYVPPDEERKSELARSVDLFEQVDRETAAARFNREAGERAAKLRTVLDATLGLVGRQLAETAKAMKAGPGEDGKLSGGMTLKPSDIAVVIRGFELLERSEARRLAMLPSGGDDDGQGQGGGHVVAVSQRVLQARESGGDELAAIEEDLDELLMIVRTAREHERSSNVIPLPRTG